MANAKFNYPPRCRREWRKSKPASSLVPPGMWLELRGAISSDVKLSDC
jgi:hypothetical protein